MRFRTYLLRLFCIALAASFAMAIGFAVTGEFSCGPSKAREAFVILVGIVAAIITIALAIGAIDRRRNSDRDIGRVGKGAPAPCPRPHDGGHASLCPPYERTPDARRS